MMLSRKISDFTDKQQVLFLYQDMLDSKNSDPDFMNIIITGDESWVYGYDPETKSFRRVPYNETDESTKHYLTQMLLTDAINRREKSTHAYEVSRSPHASALHWNPLSFRKEK